MCASPRNGRCSRCNAGGFGLLEAIVGLAIIGVTLLFSVSILAQEMAAARRLDAQRQAMAAMDRVVEALRGGALPLADPPPPLPQSYARPPATTGSDLILYLDLEEAETDDLWRIRVRARYSVQRRIYHKEVHTLLWQP